MLRLFVLSGMMLGLMLPASATENLKVKVDGLKVTAKARSFALQLANDSLDGLQCVFDFALTVKNPSKAVDASDAKTTTSSSSSSSEVILPYQAELSIAYQSKKTFTQDNLGQALGAKVVPEKAVLQKVELKKQTCKVIAPLISAQIHRGKRGFIYLMQNAYSGRDYICRMTFKMFFNHGIVSEVTVLPQRVNAGQNWLESQAHGVAYFNSHQAAFADLKLQKVQVASATCSVVPVD